MSLLHGGFSINQRLATLRTKRTTNERTHDSWLADSLLLESRPCSESRAERPALVVCTQVPACPEYRTCLYSSDTVKIQTHANQRQNERPIIASIQQRLSRNNAKSGHARPTPAHAKRKRTSTPEQHECRATPRGFKDLRLHVKNYRLIYISPALKVVKTL